MASRNMQINLQFNANVQNARTQLQSLQTQLNNLINSNTASTSLGITPQIQEATRSAMDLKIALNNAMNVNTGKLNLNKFQSELNRMGKDIGYFKQQMQMLGPEGVKAFTQVASAVAQADTKLFSLQGGMKKLANTFMNTIRWQLTSQAIMAVTSAISETVSYAKELDTSLNNIRIVTGKSADQMATFAKQANNAAKVLSTSTTKYTDASLIYYQQGLNDKAVKERTDVTVKLANVVGESAQTVSEWMTAIWNNFDDGSESLEYYADVLAKLGAATASSADEIAGGLEKFAAVAETIGLSYEYAASALATITAETRQSEDVVGTALKTILSRMEQLKQGDTLEDGTTLGQYSLALQKVGVDIKDTSGELKDMDIILEQTGARWQTLGRDQQIALAQSVAGIRQYTQFMALMDNWDVMEKNLELTEQANGALTEQQRIYEESTKAAEERMKVASEAIKATLLGGDDMTKLYNFGADALEVISELLEAFGGLPTILLAVATALTKVYQPQVASFLSQAALAGKDLAMNIRHPIKAIKGELVSSGQQTRIDTIKAATSAAAANAPVGTATVIQAQSDAYEKLIRSENSLNASVKQRAQWELDILQTKQEQVLALAEEAEKQKQNGQMAYSQIETEYKDKAATKIKKQAVSEGKVQSHLGMMNAITTQGQQTEVTMDSAGRSELGNVLQQELQKVENSAKNLGIALEDIKGFEMLKIDIEQLSQGAEVALQDIIDKINQVQSELAGGVASDKIINPEIYKAMKPINQKGRDSRNTVEAIDNLQNMAEPQSTGSAEEKRNSAVQAHDTIDQNLGKMKEDTITTKTGKAKLEQWKRESAEIRKLGKNHKDYNTKVAKLTKDIKKHTNVQNKNNKTLRGTYNTNKRLAKSEKELSDIRKKKTKELKANSDAMKKDAKTTETSSNAVKDLGKQYNDFGEKLDNNGAGFKHWSDSLASGISTLAQTAMGITMVMSAAEQMGEAFAKGDQSITDWISNLSSMAMGLAFVMPQMMNMSKKIWESTAAWRGHKLALDADTIATYKQAMAEKARNIITKMGIVLQKLFTAETWKGIAAKIKDTAVSIVNGIANIGKWIAKNLPMGLAIAAAALPFLVMAGGMAISAGSGSAKGEKEAKQEEVSKGTESLEAINENQELAGSVEDLTEEYYKLRASGESTADVLEDMREKIPELIDNYKELAKTLGTNIDTSRLEKAYEVFETTGDITLFQKEQSDIDQQIKNKEKNTAQTTITNARDLVMDAARKGDGGKYGNEFNVAIGDSDISNKDEKKTRNILKEKLGNKADGGFWNDDADEIQFDMTNEGEIIDAYNSMLEARDALLEEGYTDDNNDYLREINREIKEMSENMPDLINAHQQLFEIQKEEALLNEEQFNKDVGLKQVKSLEDYTAKRQELIDKLKEEKKWTDAQAEAYLAASDAYGNYENTINFFGENGMASFDPAASEEEIKKVKDWFANLSEEERTLAMTIDYTVVANVEEAKAALEEAREKMRIAAATKEATELGADANTFETYAEILQATNEHLKDNEAAAYEVAAANVRVNKGLEDLSKNWSENLKKITKNTKGSYEYAEGISEISKSLETMFGVKPSVNFVETHLQDIEDMLNGDKEAFEELQGSLAEDYVTNMLIEPEIVFDGNTDAVYNEAEIIRDALQGALNELGDLEIGENVVLSDKYTKVLQEALDAGQITQKQLEDAFKIKGYDLDFKTKTVPGPKTHYKRTYDVPLVGDVVVEYDEETEMTVPLINGADTSVSEGGSSGGKAKLTATRTADNTTLNPTKTEENAEKKQDHIDDLKDEKDRYHEINEIISDTERKLDKLGRAKDRAFGANKIALMKQEIKAQEKLIENNKKLLEEAESYYKQDRSDLLSNYAVKLDEAGRITNYEELQDNYIKRLKAAAGNEELYNDINKEYEEFKETAERYEESLNKVEEQAETLDSQLDELYDKNLSLIEYKVQIKVDIADDDQAYIDFLMQKTEDDAFAAAENINLLGQSAQATLNKITATNQGIQDVQNDLAAGKITPEQAAEKLREYRNDLIDYNAELLEIRNTVQEKLTDAYDAWNEKLDKNAAKIEHLTSITDSYKNIIDIVGKDTLGISDEAMAKLTDTQVNNANNALKASKAKLEANEAFLKDLQQKRADAIAKYGEDSDEVADWDEQIEYAEEQVMSAKEEFMGNWENALTAAADAFANHVDTIVENFSEAMGGAYKNLEQLQEAFDRQAEVNDRYLQQYEKTYEINKLNRSIQDSIDKTDNVASQKELRELQQELLAMQKDGVNVSQRDIEYMQKKYDLLVAEQALKDAQNTKSVVRLTRDSEGNFGYTYTADQDTVDNAQQNYEDKLYAMQKFGDESLQEIQEQILATNTEFKQALEDIASDETLSLEEKEAKVAEVTEYYTGKLKYWTDEANKFMQHGQEMNTEYNAGMASSFNETLLGKMYPDLTTFQGYYEQGMGAMDTAGSKFTEALEGYQGRIKTVFDNAGTDVKTFADDVAGENGYLSQINEKSDEAGDEAERLAQRMKDALTGEDGATNAVEDFYNDYAEYMKNVREETNDTIQKVNDLIKKYNELANTDKGDNSGTGSGEDRSGTGSGSGTETGGNYGNITTTPAGLTSGDTTTYRYKVGKASDKAEDGGYTRLEDSSGNYIGYAKTSSTTLNTDKTMANVTGDIYDYLIYDANENVVEGIKDGKNFTSHNSPGNIDRDIDICSFDEGSYKDGTNNLHSAIRERAGYILVNNTRYYAFKFKNKDYQKHNGWYFAPIGSIIDDVGSTKPQLNHGSKFYSFVGYDTGGYTGEWGPEGRMAMLHQKEIVLNAHDTENFLAAIGIVRDISDQIEKNAIVMQYQNQLANYRASIGNTGETLQQEVHITAEFPNATNHNEIEEAFKNLTNLASQYANRK